MINKIVPKLKILRFKSSSVGPEFKSIEEIEQYLKPESCEWSVNDFLKVDESQQSNMVIPSNQDISRLLKLSGLPQISSAEKLEKIRKNLSTQISFINKLHSVELSNDKTFKPQHARILPRETKKLTLDDLKNQIETSAVNKEALGEISGYWDPTSLASISKDGFYVVREGLIKNRK
ncbi:glutamyl-tRNA(Gln) amidotransferase subunit F SCDLUD_002315 [Saccharomycodes ludwigii]|uniref:glutamyl-tRNA(Gln) amidotransferase subunit F n=1 Tax=Saccharomycodes ludwigii TaxID=36035 RepID=UPI001E86CCF8|nr:hypothetical protein SCDLUD_002315 [Saccharomycodes ludwigii]KAH3900860.1 hypothetical protein SCDLUD_002315 [Saccharomycodes ludwigii]